MNQKFLFLGLFLAMFFACEKANVEEEKKKETFTFKKIKWNLRDGKIITAAKVLEQIPDAKKKRYQLKKVTVSDSKIAEVNGKSPNFQITLKKTGTFKITILLEKKGFLDTELTGDVEVVSGVTFQKLNWTLRQGKTITAKQILGQVRGLSGLGYTLESIAIPANKAEFAQVQGNQPNFQINIKKVGSFTADIVLGKTGHSDVPIANCEFEVLASEVIFQKLNWTLRQGNKITAKEILGQVRGLSGLGYIIKSIAISQNKTEFAEIEGFKPDFEIKLKKAGSFTADIVLGKTGFLDVPIANCAFEMQVPVVTFQKHIQKSRNTTITAKQILGQVRGLSGLGYTIKSITIPQNKAAFAEIENSPNFQIKLKKAGSFTADIVLGKTGFLDVPIANCAFGYVFDIVFGGSNLLDTFSAIIKTTDGHLVVAGTTSSKGEGKSDAWVLKLNKENGTILWEKTYGGTEDDGATAIVETSDGNFAVAGYTESKGVGGRDVWILKINKNDGTKIWDKAYGSRFSDSAKAIVETSDGNLAIVGTTQNTSRDVWVLKVSKERGSHMWEKTYGGSNTDEGGDLIKMADGNLAVAGYYTTTPSKGAGSLDGLVFKINVNYRLNIMWEKTFGGTNVDRIHSIIETSDGNLVVAGYTASKGAGGRDGWILKINKENGNKIWEKTFGDPQNNILFSIIETSDDNLVAAGNTKTQRRSYDAWVLKINKNDGSKVWEKTYGGNRWDDASAIVETADGNLAVAGMTSIAGGKRHEAWLFKIYANDGAMVGTR